MTPTPPALSNRKDDTVMARGSQVMRVRLHLLVELRAGSRKPGSPIPVNEIAQTLRISHTPVREALAMLAGEGAVVTTDDRGGFALPRLGWRRYIDLIQLSELLLCHVAVGKQSTLYDLPILDQSATDPLTAIEAIIAALVSNHDNAQVVRSLARTGNILAPYRRVEPKVIPDWQGELHRLRDGIAGGAPQHAIRSYFAVRTNMAGQIVDAAERGDAAPNISQI